MYPSYRSSASRRGLVVRLLLLAAVAFAPVARPAAAQAPASPVLVSLTANGAVAAELRPGWPLLVQADVLHRDAYAQAAVPVTVGTVGGSWVGALRLEGRDAAGQPLVLPLHAAAGTPEGALVLDAATAGLAAWWLTPEEAAALAPGTYTLAAVLDSTALGSGAASPRSVPVVLTVHGPGAETPAQQARRLLLLADLHGLRGVPAEALAAVDALLAAQPGHPAGLARRGDLLRAAGRTADAVAALMQASEAFHQLHPDAGEPFAAVDLAYAEALTAWEHATGFAVTVADKGPNHPYAGEGTAQGFALDGLPGAELTLDRGTTYTFDLSAVPAAHPFYLTTSPVGGGAAPYTDGVTATRAALSFTPGEGTPDLLYYQSTAGDRMGWRLHIRTAPSGVGVEPDGPSGLPGGFALSEAYPNPFNPSTQFTLTLSEPQPVRVELFDALGRRVALLHDGPLAAGTAHTFAIDGARLPSGPYLYRATGPHFRATRAAVLLK